MKERIKSKQDTGSKIRHLNCLPLKEFICIHVHHANRRIS